MARNLSVQNQKTGENPFGFCWPDSSAIVQTSSLTCSEIARAEVQNRPGIATNDGIHIPADYKPPDEFWAWKTKEGLDCGLVFVANKPFGTKNNIKLIVLAGFGGIGTLAVGQSMVQDFRYLDPSGMRFASTEWWRASIARVRIQTLENLGAFVGDIEMAATRRSNNQRSQGESSR